MENYIIEDMKSITEFINESSNDLKKQIKSLVDDYVDSDEENAELLDRAINLILSAKNLDKNEVAEVEDRYTKIDIENQKEVEDVLDLAMKLVHKIK